MAGRYRSHDRAEARGGAHPLGFPPEGFLGPRGWPTDLELVGGCCDGRVLLSIGTEASRWKVNCGS